MKFQGLKKRFLLGEPDNFINSLQSHEISDGRTVFILPKPQNKIVEALIIPATTTKCINDVEQISFVC